MRKLDFAKTVDRPASNIGHHTSHSDDSSIYFLFFFGSARLVGVSIVDCLDDEATELVSSEGL